MELGNQGAKVHFANGLSAKTSVQCNVVVIRNHENIKQACAWYDFCQ